MLNTGLPRAWHKSFHEQERSALFEHQFESYPEGEVGVYALAV